MQELKNDYAGGRNLLNDDLRALQAQFYMVPELLRGLGPFVVSGCAVQTQGNTFNVGPGEVYLDGRFYEFDGASSVPFGPPAFELRVGPSMVEEVPRPFTGLSTSKPGIVRRKAVLFPQGIGGSGQRLLLNTSGFRTFREAMQDALTPLGTLRMFDSNMSSSFGTDGKGLGLLRGWAIADGRNRPGGGMTNYIPIGSGGAGAIFQPGDESGSNINTGTSNLGLLGVFMATYIGTGLNVLYFQ